jgi:Copper transport outer membrane protein, MctB
MFDLRYHVVSLAAVFLALVVGIVVGIGISDRAFPRGTERLVLEQEIEDLQRQVDGLKQQHADDAVTRKAADAILRQAYPELVAGRLHARHVAVVYVGPVDGNVDARVRQALADAGGPPIMRVRAIKVPIDPESIDRVLAGHPALTAYYGPDNVGTLGHQLGDEFVTGSPGETPLWDRLSNQLVDERSGSGRAEADAVVVVRSVQPQQGPTARFLRGLYAGLATSGVPAVAVQSSRTQWPGISAYHDAGLSTIDSIDTLGGQAALVLLLAGGQPGDYGFTESARNGVLPPIDSVPAPVTTRG